jgi:hypothetical protein
MDGGNASRQPSALGLQRIFPSRRRVQSLTAKAAKDAKEQKSFTAKDAKDAKEINNQAKARESPADWVPLPAPACHARVPDGTGERYPAVSIRAGRQPGREPADPSTGGAVSPAAGRIIVASGALDRGL